MTSTLPEVLEKLERATPGWWPEPEPSRFVPDKFNVGDRAPYMLVGRDEHDLRAAVAAVNWLRENGPALLRDAGDAARYRWLREQNTITENPGAWTITRCDFTDQEGPSRYWVGTDLDAAIDAAMHAPGGATGPTRSE